MNDVLKSLKESEIKFNNQKEEFLLSTLSLENKISVCEETIATHKIEINKLH